MKKKPLNPSEINAADPTEMQGKVLVRLKFEQKILAPIHTVWHHLWNDQSYRQWTAAFSPTSYAESDWQLGSKVRFMDGSHCGIYATITQVQDPYIMVFRHEGEVVHGKLEPRGWEGFTESYFLEAVQEGTLISVEMFTAPAFEKMFTDRFPKALLLLKDISEKGAS